jgi:hypothetical protein
MVHPLWIGGTLGKRRDKSKRSTRSWRIRAVAALVLVSCAGASPSPTAPRSRSYEDLVALFADWRAFQKPRVIDGVPDYTQAAMAAQDDALAGYRKKLAAIDRTGWPVARQVDYHLLRAEMNGLEFDHRVLQPWARNPAFYVTVVADESDQPAREGPFALGTVGLWEWPFPLTGNQADELARRLSPIPGLLQQARGNLTGKARDLWNFGIRALEQQRGLLAELRGKTGSHPALATATARAETATAELIDWLKAEAPSKTGPSGVSVREYDWYLINVQLLPYTWADELALMQRELARAKSALAVEEHRNHRLPAQSPVASAEEHRRRFAAAVTEYMAFLKTNDVLTVRPYMDEALRARTGQYTERRPLEFFTEVDYRDPVLMRTHGYHWFDLARMRQDPHPSPIRRGALLYNIFDTRTEGLATAMEELMMHAGLCDTRPRSRELVYILLAQRAARAIGDLRMHANQMSLDEAARFAAEETPRGWLRLDGGTVWFEQHLYLQQPAYGTSYLMGKIEIDRLLAARAQALGNGFTLRRFMDELDSTGLIPISLVGWELTGSSDRVPGVGWSLRAGIH